jgi:hypothetical protein
LRPGIALALAVLCAVAAHAADEACVQVGVGAARLPAPAPGDTLRLPHRLIAASTLRVSDARETYREGVDFRLDALEGRIIWQATRPDTAALLATYRYLPWALSGRWGESSAALPETLALGAPRSAPAEALPPGASLAIGGSKTFGLEFGNRRDANLTQSLDLTVRGQLAPEVRVRAVLTDRTTPLQPEGTTAELQDMDQVLIEVTAPWGEMRLGDVEVAERRFQFAAHQRAMEGLRARLGRAGGVQGSGAVGRGAGRHLERQFFGVDGKQGPYRLLDRLPGEDAVVVAGTERIWLDGVALQRGAAADYTVDYASGEVWFSARRGIRAVSEIRIECQVREGVFDRSYYALGGNAGDSARTVAVAWLRESDDPGRTLTVALTPAERETLQLAGDASDPIAGGARVDSLGDYALVETDSTTAPFYLFIAETADPDAYGTRYAVVFSDVGQGQGDYASSVSPLGRTYYRYVGPDRGRYAAGRRLVAPEARDLLAARAGGRIGSGFSVATEAAVSRHDQNLLSGLDDGDNVGGALALSGAWRLGAVGGGRPQALEMTWRGRAVEENFSPVEAIDPAFDYRRWNASSDSILDGRGSRGALGLAWRPRASLRGAVEWEGLRSVHDFEGRRWHLTAERSGALRARGEVWRTRTTEKDVPGEAERQQWSVGLAGRTRAEATYESEEGYRGRGTSEEGERFAAAGLRVGSDRWLRGLDAEFLGEFRRDWERQAGVSRRKDDRGLYQTNLIYAGGGALAHLLYARHATRDAATGRTDSRDLADWSIARQDPDARATGEWRGSLTVEEKRLRVEQLQPVGSGLGHYDSLGRYVGRGDFELYYQDADSSELETRFETALRASAHPFAGSTPSALAGLETIFFGRIVTTTPEPPGWLLGATSRWFGGEGALRRHQRVLRGEIAWVGGARAPTPRLRVEGRRDLERSVSGLTRESTTLQRMLEVRWSPREALRTRVDLKFDEEREDVGGADPDRHRVWIGGLEATWSSLRRLLLRARGEGGREHYDPAARRSIGTATLGFDLEPYAASRLEVAWERRWVRGDDVPTGPFVIEEPGWEVTTNASVQPLSGLSVTLRVRVAREDGHDAIVSGRMDARAYF